MNGETISRLEDLPDELLILIYRYLNIFEILHSFTRLNARLAKSIQEFTVQIDLNAIPLKLIDRFVNEIFPCIKSDVRSLIFPDNLQRFPIDIDQFANLESIHFLSRYSSDYLVNINQIEIDLVPVEFENDLLERLFSSNLNSKLKSLSLTSFHGFRFSNVHFVNSIAIEHLTISLKNNVDLFELLYFLSPSIEYLNLHIRYNGPLKSLSNRPFKFPKLRSFHLKTTPEDSIQFQQLENFILQSFASLEYFSIETLTRDENYINGYQWETFLTKLISLQTFVCSIRYRFQIDDDYDQQINEDILFKSFSTDFWIEQRKWFIQFYWKMSIPDQVCSYKTKNYGKLFLHTIPYPYTSMDTTSDIINAKSTLKEEMRRIYSNVRHLYYDGESIPIQLENLKTILDQFSSLNQLKFDRLIIESSSSSLKFSNSIEFRHLNQLIIYNNEEKICFHLQFLNLISMFHLKLIRIPQILLPNANQMPKQLQTLILTECRDLNFDFVHQCTHLRVLKLYLTNFDRVLDNNGQLLKNLIRSIYTNNQTMESFQLMCHGINQTKVKTFEKQFNSMVKDYLKAFYDGKCLAIERLKDYFN